MYSLRVSNELLYVMVVHASPWIFLLLTAMFSLHMLEVLQELMQAATYLLNVNILREHFLFRRYSRSVIKPVAKWRSFLKQFCPLGKNPVDCASEWRWDDF